MGDQDQDCEDTSQPGCCGLSIKRKGKTKTAAHSKSDDKNQRTLQARKDSETEDTDQSYHPINLAGISLNLGLTLSDKDRNHLNMSDTPTDNRLEEFKQIFCGGNELHCVDFIRMWGFYDKDHSGYLETRELDKFIKDLIQQKGQQKPDPKLIKDVRDRILCTADINRDGKIELAEFSRCLPVEKNFLLKFDKRDSLSRKEFNDIFSHYDPDGNDYIEGHEILALLRDLLTKSGLHVGVSELEDYKAAVIDAYDKNHDGKLSRSELGMILSVDK